MIQFIAQCLFFNLLAGYSTPALALFTTILPSFSSVEGFCSILFFASSFGSFILKMAFNFGTPAFGAPATSTATNFGFGTSTATTKRTYLTNEQKNYVFCFIFICWTITDYLIIIKYCGDSLAATGFGTTSFSFGGATTSTAPPNFGLGSNAAATAASGFGNTIVLDYFEHAIQKSYSMTAEKKHLLAYVHVYTTEFRCLSVPRCKSQFSCLLIYLLD